MSSEMFSIEAIRERAAQWVERLQASDAIGEAERAELHAWLLADPRHDSEFRAHNAVVKLAHDFPSNVYARLSAFAPTARPASARRRWVPSALAAALLLALLTGGWLMGGRAWLHSETYATRTGQVRTVSFEDGSVAYLNTRTQLKWLGDPRDRRVALLEGEALFDVVHDPDRPFRVMLDGSEIRVLGTRFNVYRKKDGETTVTVLEGAVDVRGLGEASGHPAWQRRLAANQQVVYGPLGLEQDVRETAGETATKWRQGVIEIHEAPLPQVLAELTRYTDQHIVIRDPALNQVRVGGVLSVRDVRVALGRLQKLAPVTVTESDDTFTLDSIPQH